MALVGMGGALATRMASQGGFPEWVPLTVAFGGALLAVFHTGRCRLRPAEELGPAIRRALLAGPLGALLAWGILAIAAR